jgi:hypothetical protein
MESQIYEMIKDLIQSLGFPIFVAVWFMWRDGKRMEKLTQAINDLQNMLEKVCNKLDGT